MKTKYTHKGSAILKHPADRAPVKKVTPSAAIVGFSNSGKTTLLEKLIHEMVLRGIRVGTIKHDVHGFDMDRPGKDTWRHKQAGASTTIISSPRQIGMVMDVNHDHDPLELISLMPDMDLVLFEGYKSADIPKIEVFRMEVSEKIFCKGDPNLIAVVSDRTHDIAVPCFGHDDIGAIADFLIDTMALTPSGDGKEAREAYA